MERLYAKYVGQFISGQARCKQVWLLVNFILLAFPRQSCNQVVTFAERMPLKVNPLYLPSSVLIDTGTGFRLGLRSAGLGLPLGSLRSPLRKGRPGLEQEAAVISNCVVVFRIC